MSKIPAFVFFLSFIINCSAQIKDLSPADFGVLSTDGKTSLHLIKKYKLSAKPEDIAPPGVKVSLAHVDDYQVIIKIYVSTNKVETLRGIRVGDNKSKLALKYGKGEESTRDGSKAIEYILDDYNWGELDTFYPFIGLFLLEFILDKDKIKEIRISVEYGF